MKAQIFNYSIWIDITDPSELKKIMTEILHKSGFGICGEIEKKFIPFGFTILYLLSESHLALHTFPEENITYLELSSCIKNPFDKFIKNLQIYLDK